MSKFIALLCAATVAVSASAVFAADSDDTDTKASATATATASASASATATAEADEDAEATASASATATAAATATAEATEAPSFTDVDEDAYYAESVAFCAERGLFNGTSETEFSPELTMTRAMFATVFARLEKADLSGDYTLTFKDVTDEFYAPYIAWATEQGIMEGYSAEEFGPNDAITREQAAKMIYAYMSNVADEELVSDEAADYTDVASVSDWAAEAIAYNMAAGYLLADEDGNINPQDELKRADACYAVATAVKALEAAEATAAPTASATPDASAAPDASASPKASATPDASASPKASATPDASASPEASATPDASASPKASASPAATATATAEAE